MKLLYLPVLLSKLLLVFKNYMGFILFKKNVMGEKATAKKSRSFHFHLPFWKQITQGAQSIISGFPVVTWWILGAILVTKAKWRLFLEKNILCPMCPKFDRICHKNYSRLINNKVVNVQSQDHSIKKKNIHYYVQREGILLTFNREEGKLELPLLTIQEEELEFIFYTRNSQFLENTRIRRAFFH